LASISERFGEHWRRILILFRGARFDRELDEEMRLHRELRQEEQRGTGAGEREARFATERRFGNTLELRERGRDMWGWNWLEDFLQDVRYALRMLRKRPGFAAVAVITLALGIGANTAIFSVVDAVLLRPLPYKDPGRLVFMLEDSPTVPGMSISMANFNDWRAMNGVFESMFPYRTTTQNLTGEGDAESLRVRQVTAGLFPTFGVQPVLGRALTGDDDKVGAAPVVLLSDGFWARKFAKDPNVIGGQIKLDGELYTIIGVLPSSRFHASWRRISVFTSLWRLEDVLGGPTQRDEHPSIVAIGKMKPGVTVEQARANLKDVAARLAKQYPATNTNHTVLVDPLLSSVVSDVKTSLWVLLAAVGFVLLIACANVANLMLARATERHREMAIRVALGAGRGRLVRQLLTESLLLALVGGGLGLGIAYITTGALASATPTYIPRAETVAVDGSVLAYSLSISVFTGLFFGLFPAWQVSRTDVHAAMGEGGRGGTASSGRKRVRSALVVAEVAVSIVLLIGTGLMVKSFYRVLVADAGFNPVGVLTTSFMLPDSHYHDPAKQAQFKQQFVEKIAATPGVQSVGIESPLLNGSSSGYIVDGWPDDPQHQRNSDITSVTPDALRTMGVQLIRGRFFTSNDNEKAPLVCIVDTELAEVAWPGQDPIGKRVQIGSSPYQDELKRVWRTVVGEVAHVKNYGVDQPSREQTYTPIAQRPRSDGTLVIRAASDRATVASEVRAAMNSLDRDIPLSPMIGLDEIVLENVAPRRLSVMLLSTFAGLALLLASVGIYGVMSYMVAQRTQEIGIRMALGAQRGDILQLILRGSMVLLVWGIGMGLAGAFLLSRYLQSLLFEVTPTDLLTYLGVPLLLAVVALMACYLPTRRALRVDPITALRYE